MADDGMIVNFEIPTDAFAAPPPTKIKGGNWKARLTARRAAKYERQKIQDRQSQGPDAAKSAESPRAAESQSHARPAKRARIGDGNHTTPANNGDFVSSLFTFNPTSQAPREGTTSEEINVEPSNAPLANDETAKFTTLGLSPSLAGHLLKKLDIKAPTAIQRKAIKQLCTHDTDAFIQAQTGSGKTLSYLLPIVERIATISKHMRDAGRDFNRHSGLFAIILAPTRELSTQISTVLDSLLHCYHWIVTGNVQGGEKKKSEKARLRKGLNILVATPGRLADHLNNTETFDVSRVRWLVLDEGDRLMELGFEQDLQKIIGALNLRSRKKQQTVIPGLPDDRTTVLCSATIKADVERLQSMSLKSPVSISVDASEAIGRSATDENNFSAPAQLKQSYAIVPAKQRLVTLNAVLTQTFKRKGSVMKCIVFISCADSVDFHFEILTRGGKKDVAEREAEPTNDQITTRRSRDHPSKKPGSIPQGNTISETRTQGRAAFSSKDNSVQAFRLHGSLQQATRTSTLKAYTKCEEPAILVCTDVASRGLDLPNVDLVIEYDAPFSKDDHIHRIGRTARAGRDGRAMIFLQPGCEEGYVEVLKESRPRNLTRHDADELLKKGFGNAKGSEESDKEWEVRATDWQLGIERWAIDNPKHLEQARRAYQSHVRAYATHVAAERHIFDMQELHLGHLAKAFALRDKPGSINVAGLRPGKDSGNKSKRAKLQKGSKGGLNKDLDLPPDVDASEAKKKMQAMSRAMGGASEFNLG